MINKKKKKLILHIGMHKTGSSSIQDTLHYNLKDPNIKYIDLGVPNHSGALNQLFSNDTNREVKERIRSKLLSNLTTKHNIYIISAEDLSTFSEESLISAKLFFEDIFDDIVVIGYIREPKGWIESAYQQILKDHKSYMPLDAIRPNYQFKFEKFDKLFGKENVKLYKFDSKNFPQNDIVLDFCGKINLSAKINIIRSNESISKEAVSILYVHRKYAKTLTEGRDYSQENIMLVETLSGIGTSKFKISPDFFYTILTPIRDDVLWMEARLNCPLLDQNYLNHPDEITSEKDLERFAVSFAFSDSFKSFINNSVIKKKTFHRVVTGMSAIISAIKGEHLDAKEIDKQLIDLITDEREKNVALLRDAALLLEKYDIHKAYELMKLAHYLRPHGPVIISKINEYEKIIQSELRI